MHIYTCNKPEASKAPETRSDSRINLPKPFALKWNRSPFKIRGPPCGHLRSRSHASPLGGRGADADVTADVKGERFKSSPEWQDQMSAHNFIQAGIKAQSFTQLDKRFPWGTRAYPYSRAPFASMACLKETQRRRRRAPWEFQSSHHPFTEWDPFILQLGLIMFESSNRPLSILASTQVADMQSPIGSLRHI